MHHCQGYDMHWVAEIPENIWTSLQWHSVYFFTCFKLSWTFAFVLNLIEVLFLRLSLLQCMPLLLLQTYKHRAHRHGDLSSPSPPRPPPDPSGATTLASGHAVLACLPPPATSLRRHTHAFSTKEIPIQSYKTTTVHLLHTNLQVPLSLLQRQGSKEDEDNVLAETVTKSE